MLLGCKVTLCVSRSSWWSESGFKFDCTVCSFTVATPVLYGTLGVSTVPFPVVCPASVVNESHWTLKSPAVVLVSKCYL